MKSEMIPERKKGRGILEDHIEQGELLLKNFLKEIEELEKKPNSEERISRLRKDIVILEEALAKEKGTANKMVYNLENLEGTVQ